MSIKHGGVALGAAASRAAAALKGRVMCWRNTWTLESGRCGFESWLGFLLNYFLFFDCGQVAWLL